MYLWLACAAVACDLNWSITISFSAAILLSFTKLSTAVFDSPINILVVLWFKSTWTILEIKGCTLAEYQYRDTIVLAFCNFYKKSKNQNVVRLLLLQNVVLS